MELQSGAHISLMSCTFNTCHVDGNMHGNDMQMRLCIVKLGVVSSICVISGRSRGGDARTHNLPLTRIYNKGIFAQVLAYTWFYKSEKIHAYAKSSFCAYIHF